MWSLPISLTTLPSISPFSGRTSSLSASSLSTFRFPICCQWDGSQECVINVSYEILHSGFEFIYHQKRYAVNQPYCPGVSELFGNRQADYLFSNQVRDFATAQGLDRLFLIH